MNPSASPTPSRKKTLLSLVILVVLTVVVVLIFREHWELSSYRGCGELAHRPQPSAWLRPVPWL